MPPPKNLNVMALEGQGRPVEREGILIKTRFLLGRPSRFRLVRYEGHLAEVTCYLVGPEQTFTALEGQKIKVRGHEYWVHKSQYPVVVVDTHGSTTEFTE